MENYLKPLETKLTSLLGKRYFDLDDGGQSFNVYPSNHINLINDFISIEVATCVYSNITEYNHIIENIVALYDQSVLLSDKISDYVSINVAAKEKHVSVSIGGLDSDLETNYFKTIPELLTYMKEFDNY